MCRPALPGLSQTNDKLVERYSSFAGSESDAKALVTGLRSGNDITLSSGSGSSATTTIANPISAFFRKRKER